MAELRDERLYLTDIKDAIDRVLRYTHAGREAFFTDPMAQDAVVRNIEIMGEATRAVSEALKKAHPEIPWRDIPAGETVRGISQELKGRSRTEPCS